MTSPVASGLQVGGGCASLPPHKLLTGLPAAQHPGLSPSSILPNLPALSTLPLSPAHAPLFLLSSTRAGGKNLGEGKACGPKSESSSFQGSSPPPLSPKGWPLNSQERAPSLQGIRVAFQLASSPQPWLLVRAAVKQNYCCGTSSCHCEGDMSVNWTA